MTEPSAGYAGQHWDADAVLSYAQQRWYDPRTGRFLSEDPVGATDERIAQPGRMHAFAYGAGNPLLWTDPLGLDVGQPESTSARAQEDMRYQAGRNDNNKDQGNWAQGCAAGLADNWKNLDGGAMEAGNHSPEYLAGYVRCQGANLDSYRNSAIAKNTREFWTATPERAGAMGCVLGGGSALSPVGGDVNNLPSNMQSSAGMCQFGVGAATAVMTAGELGVSGYRALKNFRLPMGPAPAFAGISNEARGVAAAEEATAAERMPSHFEATKRGEASGAERAAAPEAAPRDPSMGQRVPPPKELEAFPSVKRATPKTPVQGGGGLRKRWKDGKGGIYEWDSRHGTVERYSKTGEHLGEFDARTGEQLKPADPSREVEP